MQRFEPSKEISADSINKNTVSLIESLIHFLEAEQKRMESSFIRNIFMSKRKTFAKLQVLQNYIHHLGTISNEKELADLIRNLSKSLQGRNPIHYFAQSPCQTAVHLQQFKKNHEKELHELVNHIIEQSRPPRNQTGQNQTG